MNWISKVWNKLWGRSDRDIYILEKIIDIEEMVHDLGVWHITDPEARSPFTFDDQVAIIHMFLEDLVGEYNILFAETPAETEAVT